MTAEIRYKCLKCNCESTTTAFCGVCNLDMSKQADQLLRRFEIKYLKDDLSGMIIAAQMEERPNGGYVLYTDHKAQIEGLQRALREALVVLESIEAKTLIGHEGCLWPAEIVRAALAKSDRGEMSQIQRYYLTHSEDEGHEVLAVFYPEWEWMNCETYVKYSDHEAQVEALQRENDQQWEIAINQWAGDVGTSSQHHGLDTPPAEVVKRIRQRVLASRATQPAPQGENGK